MTDNFSTVASVANEKIKLVKKLKLKKYRQQTGLFAAENLNLVLDGAGAGFLPRTLFVTRAFYQKNKASLAGLVKKIGSANAFFISQGVARSISNLDEPPGLAAIFPKNAGCRLNALLFEPKIIYLNGIGDPGNLGAILRAALAFNLKALVLDEQCADLYNPKTVSAAKDAIFKLHLAFDSNLKILRNLKQSRKIIITRLEQAQDIKEIKKHPSFCLVLGSEARGVAGEIQKLADISLKIPISPDMESLNVANAAAICFYLISN